MPSFLFHMNIIVSLSIQQGAKHSIHVGRSKTAADGTADSCRQKDAKNGSGSPSVLEEWVEEELRQEKCQDFVVLKFGSQKASNLIRCFY